MKPQDLLVALALTPDHETATYAELADRTGLSPSQCHQAVQRLERATLVDGRRRVRPRALYDFVISAAAIVFPAAIGGPSQGVPTGAAAFETPGGLPEDLPAPSPDRWVWPDPAGDCQGLAVSPLHAAAASLGRSSTADPLYRALAAIDLIRLGDARSSAFGARHLRRFLHLEAVETDRVDVRAPTALASIFSLARLEQSVRKWLGEGSDDPSAHPLERPILSHLGATLVRRLADQVPRAVWRAQPAAHVVMAKGTPSATGDHPPTAPRDLAWPALIDRLVARRLIDSLEPFAREGDDERVFLNRRFARSGAARGDYQRWFEEWRAYQRSVAAAATEDGLAVALKADIAQFFPTTDSAIARAALARETRAHTDVGDLVFECLHTWRPRLGYGALSGLPQDPVGLSGLVAHCVLRPVDRAFGDQYDRTYRRFVDDTIIFVPDQASADRARDDYVHALAQLGLRPNPAKTVCQPAAEVLEEQHDGAFSAIDDAVRAGDGDRLARLTRQWRRKAPDDAHLRRRLYSAHARLQTTHLDDDLLADLGHPGLRDHALSYLASRPLSPSRWAHLAGAWAATADGFGAIRIAQTLADTPLTDANLAADVIEWCLAEARPREAESPGWLRARGHLLGVLFRLAPSPVVHAHLRAVEATGRREPAFAHALDLVGIGAFGDGWDAEPVDPWSDHGLSQWLLRDAALGRLENPLGAIGAALGSRRRRGPVPRRSPLPTRALPFLYAAERGLLDPGQRAQARAWIVEAFEAPQADVSARHHGHLFSQRAPA